MKWLIACAVLLSTASSDDTSDTTSIMNFQWDSCFALDTLSIEEVQQLEKARLEYFQSLQDTLPEQWNTEGFWTIYMREWMLAQYDSLAAVGKDAGVWYAYLCYCSLDLYQTASLYSNNPELYHPSALEVLLHPERYNSVVTWDDFHLFGCSIGVNYFKYSFGIPIPTHWSHNGY